QKETNVSRHPAREIDNCSLEAIPLRPGDFFEQVIKFFCLALQGLLPAGKAVVNGAAAIGTKLGWEAVDQRFKLAVGSRFHDQTLDHSALLLTDMFLEEVIDEGSMFFAVECPELVLPFHFPHLEFKRLLSQVLSTGHGLGSRGVGSSHEYILQVQIVESGSKSDARFALPDSGPKRRWQTPQILMAPQSDHKAGH